MTEVWLHSSVSKNVRLTIRLKHGELVIGEFSVPKYGIGEKVLAAGRAGVIVAETDEIGASLPPQAIYRVRFRDGSEREVFESRITTVYGPEERARQRWAAEGAAMPKTRHKAIPGPREGKGK